MVQWAGAVAAGTTGRANGIELRRPRGVPAYWRADALRLSTRVRTSGDPSSKRESDSPPFSARETQTTSDTINPKNQLSVRAGRDINELGVRL